MKKKIVVFDICGTLFKSNTTFDFLDYVLVSNKKYQLYKKIFGLFIWKFFNKLLRQICDLDLTRIIAISFLKNYDREDLRKKANCFYDKCLVLKSNINVINILNAYRQNLPCRIIILSATIDIVAEVIAKKLKCTEFYSTQLKYSNGICSGVIQNDLLGKKKNKLKVLNIEQIDAFYTDDISDTPVLEVAHKKVIITSHKQKNKWMKIVNKKKWLVKYIEY